MKKYNYKKLLMIAIVMMLAINVFYIDASDVTYNDDGTAYYKPIEVLMEGKYENTSYQKVNAITGYNGTESSQLIYSYIQKQTQDSKIVTWAMKKDSGKLRNATLSAIAEDYEANHEDWIVVGGINADQYTTGFGTNVAANGKDFYSPQTYYPFICDAEGWFAISPLPYYGHNVAGFLQDGSSDPIVSGSASLNGGDIKLAGIFIYILDDLGNRVQKFQINKFNESPRDCETTIWSSHFTGETEFPDITLSQKVYAVKAAERAYASNSIDYANFKDLNAYDAFFGKGEISDVGENITIGYGDFAIETKDKYLEEKLAKGVKVIVQYEYEGLLSEVESATGYHSIQKMNGIDTEGVGDYNTLPYPRSVVGRTNDGQIVLLAIDGKAPTQGRTGTRHWETNAILNSLGVIEAYQMDGGGSVTAIIRGEEGKFTVINKPADGAARSVLTGLLLVERKKPEVKNLEITQKRNEIIFDFNTFDDHGNNVEKIVLSFNDKDYELAKENLSIEFTDLPANQSFEYSLKVYINETEYTVVKGAATTISNPAKLISVTEKEDALFEVLFADEDSTIIEYYILIEDEKFYPGKDNLIKTKVLKYGKTYVVFKYRVGQTEYEEKVVLQPYKFTKSLDEMILNISKCLSDIYN